LENGKYVAPVPTKEQLRLSGFITSARVHRQNKPFNVALLVPDRAALKARAYGGEGCAYVLYAGTVGGKETHAVLHGVASLVPVASNDAPPGRVQNRRVELVKQSRLAGPALGSAFVSVYPGLKRRLLLPSTEWTSRAFRRLALAGVCITPGASTLHSADRSTPASSSSRHRGPRALTPPGCPA